MASTQNRIIHRFVKEISEYENGGAYYNQVIPVDTQAYAVYPAFDESGIEVEGKKGLFYVLGDGNHTYVEIRDGRGNYDSSKEYPVITNEDFLNKIDTIIPGANVVVTGEGPVRTISVPGVPVPEYFVSSQELSGTPVIGQAIEDLDGTKVLAIKPSVILKENDIVIFPSSHQLLVTSVDPSYTLYSGTIIFVPSTQENVYFANIKGDPIDNEALELAFDDKLSKENTPNSIYAIDEDGNQTLLPSTFVTGVTDVLVNGESVLEGTVAHISLTAEDILYSDNISVKDKLNTLDTAITVTNTTVSGLSDDVVEIKQELVNIDTELSTITGHLVEIDNEIDLINTQSDLAVKAIWGTEENPNGILTGDYGTGRLDTAELIIADLQNKKLDKVSQTANGLKNSFGYNTGVSTTQFSDLSGLHAAFNTGYDRLNATLGTQMYNQISISDSNPDSPIYKKGTSLLMVAGNVYLTKNEPTTSNLNEAHTLLNKGEIDGLLTNFVKYVAADTQIIQTNIALDEKSSLLGTLPAGQQKELIGLKTYNKDTADEVSQVEVGSSAVHLNLNSSDRPTLDLPGKKEQLAYISDLSGAKLTSYYFDGQLQDGIQTFGVPESVAVHLNDNFMLFFNGIKQRRGKTYDYDSNTRILTTYFQTAPLPTEDLEVVYVTNN